MGKYSFREAVNYPPWIGRDYGNNNSRKTLLVGRSYFDARYGNHTIPSYISSLIKSGREDPLFNAMESIVSEKQHWKQSLLGKSGLDRKKFWNSTAYHQFLQGILEEPYSVPSRQMWKESQEIFKHVVASLEPDIIVIFSQEVFDRIPTMGGRNGPEFTHEGETMSTWEFQVKGTDASICSVMNPRKGTFRLSTWKNLYYQFLSDYKDRFGKVYL